MHSFCVVSFPINVTYDVTVDYFKLPSYCWLEFFKSFLEYFLPKYTSYINIYIWMNKDLTLKNINTDLKKHNGIFHFSFPKGILFGLSFIRHRLLKIKIWSCLPVEQAFVKHESSKLFEYFSSSLRLYQSALTDIRNKFSLDFFSLFLLFINN